MKKVLKKIKDFFVEGDKWAWMLLGAIAGVFSDSLYCSGLCAGFLLLAYAAYNKADFKKDFSYITAASMVALSPIFQQLTELLINALDK